MSFNPDQPRDSDGKWSGGGSGGSIERIASEHLGFSGRADRPVPLRFANRGNFIPGTESDRVRSNLAALRKRFS